MLCDFEFCMLSHAKVFHWSIINQQGSLLVSFPPPPPFKASHVWDLISTQALVCVPGRDKRNFNVVRFHALPCLLSCSPVNNTISNSLNCTFVLVGLQIKQEGDFPLLLILWVCFSLSFARTRWLRDFSSDSLIQKLPERPAPDVTHHQSESVIVPALMQINSVWPMIANTLLYV